MSREGGLLLGSLGGVRKEANVSRVGIPQAVHPVDESGAATPPLVPQSSYARILELEAEVAFLKKKIAYLEALRTLVAIHMELDP